MPEILEDIVECEYCGAEIVHIYVSGSSPNRKDPDYRVCLECSQACEEEMPEGYPDGGKYF